MPVLHTDQPHTVMGQSKIVNKNGRDVVFIHVAFRACGWYAKDKGANGKYIMG